MGSTRSRAGIWAEAAKATSAQQAVKNSDFLILGFSGNNWAGAPKKDQLPRFKFKIKLICCMKK